MEQRTLEITVISAKDLHKVNLLSKMDVYAVVSILAGDVPKQVIKTPVDKDSGSNPTWNFTLKFTIDEEAAQQSRLSLVFKLKSERVLGDKEIGEVRVPIKELLDSPASGNAKQFVSYQVRKPDGKPRGFISFSYQFGEKTSKVVEHVTAYPPANMVGTSGSGAYHKADTYPPPPPPYGAPVGGYGHPPQYAYPAQQAYPPPPQQGYGGYPAQQAGYGYPPQQQGYGYPPQQGYGYPPVVKPPKKNKLGMGLGAGLLGGALGGMLLGDMVSDVGSYDAGYDAGFDDAGFGDAGFDF